MSIRRRRFLLFGALVFILGSGAAALTAGVLMVSPSACDLGDTLMAHKYLATDQSLSMISWDPNFASSLASFYAPLNLPQGVTLRRFIVYCIHGSSGLNDIVTINLKRVNALTGAAEFIASVDTLSLGTSPDRMALVAASLDHKIVNNRNYSYCLEIQFAGSCSSQVQFCGAKIEW